MADEAMTVMAYRAEMNSCAQLNMRGIARYAIVAADEDAEPVGNRDEPCYGNRRRRDDYRTVAAILMRTIRPWHIGTAERCIEHFIQRSVNICLNLSSLPTLVNPAMSTAKSPHTCPSGSLADDPWRS